MTKRRRLLVACSSTHVLWVFQQVAGTPIAHVHARRTLPVRSLYEPVKCDEHLPLCRLYQYFRFRFSCPAQAQIECYEQCVPNLHGLSLVCVPDPHPSLFLFLPSPLSHSPSHFLCCGSALFRSVCLSDGMGFRVSSVRFVCDQEENAGAAYERWA
jgi:hypothetical protein